MTFRIHDYRANSPIFKSHILIMVFNYIKQRPIFPAEQPLNNYLIKNYNKNLTEISLILAGKLKLQNNRAGDLIFTFLDKKYDDLAMLITYGNGVFLGSTILQDAFRKAERNS